MEVMLHAAAGEYDYVLLDSPPVLAVTDSVVLSRRTDGVLVVVQAGVTSRGHLKQAVDQLRAGNARMLGIVLNRLAPRGEGYQAYHYYHSAYYQEEGETAKRKPAPNGKGARRTGEEPAQSSAAGT
jgi:Mrp family chromosome partitioning ATPase